MNQRCYNNFVLVKLNEAKSLLLNIPEDKKDEAMKYKNTITSRKVTLATSMYENTEKNTKKFTEKNTEKFFCIFFCKIFCKFFRIFFCIFSAFFSIFKYEAQTTV